LNAAARSSSVYRRSGTGDRVVLDTPTEPSAATPHSKLFERGMGVVFVLGTAAVLVAVVYLASYFD